MSAEEKSIEFYVSGLINASLNHENYRSKECINMIASEGIKSPAVCEMLNRTHDLASRYAEGDNDIEGHVKKRYYEGQKWITKIEDFATDAIKSLFNATWADVRPISGAQANTATFKGLSLASNKKTIVVNTAACGAHVSHVKGGLTGEILGLTTINHGYVKNMFNIDPDKSARVIREEKPGIVVFGGSVLLFPHTINDELKKACKKVGAYMVYDAAHVLGLIAGKQFQSPLDEEIDFITASTHKTFPGPQGGVIMGNPDTADKEKAVEKIQASIFPLTTSSTHLGRLPALGIACLEMKLFGEALATQIIKNAQTAGEYLDKALEDYCKKTDKKCCEVAHIFDDDGKKVFTKSHQILLDVSQPDDDGKTAKNIAKRLAEANIIVNYNMLPTDKDKDKPSGLRVGFQDVTRHGMTESGIKRLCDLMMDVIKDDRTTAQVKVDVMDLKKEFSQVKYGFENLDAAITVLKNLKYTFPLYDQEKKKQ
ncbi:MAG: serine hydroxymethyltransferase [Candidatus Bathyarchaeota archaeon]|nr:serine hydroxymethyltransferase [Candidatus Termiticorpusculum sp.]